MSNLFTLRTYPNIYTANEQYIYQPSGWRIYNKKSSWYPIPLGTAPGVTFKLTDDIWICWSISEVKNQPSHYNTYKFTVDAWISVDRGVTKIDGFFNWNFANLHPNEYQVFLDALEAKKKVQERARRKQKNLERKAKLETEAKELGVPVKELAQQKLDESKKAYKHKIELSKVKKSIDEIERLNLLTTALSKLEAQIESIRGKLSAELEVESSLDLRNISTKVDKISSCTNVLKTINSGKK